MLRGWFFTYETAYRFLVWGDVPNQYGTTNAGTVEQRQEFYRWLNSVDKSWSKGVILVANAS